jgi:MYXO-CTERM domain-containing protein
VRACNVLLAAAVAASLFALGSVAHADCNVEDGGCAFNQYCGLGDGGVSGDASNASASCLAQPCVLSSDCEDSGVLCDTSHTIFQCVDCVSTADCAGDLECDPTTHTCVNPPPAPDAGEDAGDEDATAPDAATPVDAGARDASLPPTTDAGGHDASVPTFDAGEPGEDAGPSPGSLAGGACDCDVARPEVGMGAAGLPLGVALLFAVRRRRRPR